MAEFMATTRNVLIIVADECTAANGRRLLPKVYSGTVTRDPAKGADDKPTYFLAEKGFGGAVDVTDLVQSGVLKVIGE